MVKIFLGKEFIGGLGVGGVFDIGRKVVEESVNEIREVIKDVKLVIVFIGFGGGIGIGVIFIIVKIVKEVGVFMIVIVIKFFKYEGF